MLFVYLSSICSSFMIISMYIYPLIYAHTYTSISIPTCLHTHILICVYLPAYLSPYLVLCIHLLICHVHHCLNLLCHTQITICLLVCLPACTFAFLPVCVLNCLFNFIDDSIDTINTTLVYKALMLY